MPARVAAGAAPQGDFRGYSLSVGELDRLRSARRERLVAHAFRLCDHALEQDRELPLELVDGDGQGWLADWIDHSGFDLVVVAHEHRTLAAYLPASLSARVRRGVACPVLVVK
jgi:nucleotide-binding universal stress UspA family protein